MGAFGMPAQGAHERYLRDASRLHAEFAAGEGSRTATLTLRQRQWLAAKLEGDVSLEAESLRMVYDLDEVVSAGQEDIAQVGVDSRCVSG
jgi:hypothetical protein